MQTLSDIRRLLEQAGLKPARRFGQNFLIDGNLMGKLLELAECDAGQVVLEVGPATGSLTEELLERFGHVVAVEIDRGLCELLRNRLEGRRELTLICGDVLAGKGELNRQVVRAIEPAAVLVANLPYNIATPLVGLCLEMTWRGRCRIGRMTFTVQQELADRLVADPGSGAYGPVSVVVKLLGRVKKGPAIGPESFWPRPKVASRILRIDFDPVEAEKLEDQSVLAALLSQAFSQRRKQIGSLLKRKACPYRPDALSAAFGEAHIDLTSRPERITPHQFRTAANALRRLEESRK